MEVLVAVYLYPISMSICTSIPVVPYLIQLLNTFENSICGLLFWSNSYTVADLIVLYNTCTLLWTLYGCVFELVLKWRSNVVGHIVDDLSCVCWMFRTFHNNNYIFNNIISVIRPRKLDVTSAEIFEMPLFRVVSKRKYGIILQCTVSLSSHTQ